MDEPKSDVCGEAADAPNKEDVGAEAMGVENREDDEDVVDGIAKSEDPLPDEATAIAVEVRGAVDAPDVAELANDPAT